MITGYKALNEDMTNRYGKKFEVGKTYSISGKLKFGTDGNGFHLCTKLEDTLRYVDGRNTSVKICRVTASGDKVSFNDEYYGFYDMYAVSTIKIEHVYTREELVEIFLNTIDYRTDRFIRLYKLTPDEIIEFKNRFSNNENILKTIAYYQENDHDVYNRTYKKLYKRK